MGPGRAGMCMHLKGPGRAFLARAELYHAWMGTGKLSPWYVHWYHTLEYQQIFRSLHHSWAVTGTVSSALWLSTLYNGAGAGSCIWSLYGAKQVTRSPHLQTFSRTVTIYSPGKIHWCILGGFHCNTACWYTIWKHCILWTETAGPSATRWLSLTAAANGLALLPRCFLKSDL